MCTEGLDSFLEETAHGAYPGSGGGAAKERSVGAAPGGGARGDLHQAWGGSHRPLSVPRGSHAVPRRDADEEPLALPGGMSGGWDGDRLGDAGRGDLVPARGGAVAE